MRLGQFTKDGAGRNATKNSLKHFGAPEFRELQRLGTGKRARRDPREYRKQETEQREMKKLSAGHKAGRDCPQFSNLLAWFSSIGRAQEFQQCSDPRLH